MIGSIGLFGGNFGLDLLVLDRLGWYWTFGLGFRRLRWSYLVCRGNLGRRSLLGIVLDSGKWRLLWFHWADLHFLWVNRRENWGIFKGILLKFFVLCRRFGLLGWILLGGRRGICLEVFLICFDIWDSLFLIKRIFVFGRITHIGLLDDLQHKYRFLGRLFSCFCRGKMWNLRCFFAKTRENWKNVK